MLAIVSVVLMLMRFQMDEHLNYRGPEAFNGLRNMYWNLRIRRSYDNAARRKWYRRIKLEKDRLSALGYSIEHMRLFCRYMSNPLPDSPALRRLWAYDLAVRAFGKENCGHDISGPNRTVASRRAQAQALTQT